jgi:CubicO group peptidase (beta-lactamase class C family)
MNDSGRARRNVMGLLISLAIGGACQASSPTQSPPAPASTPAAAKREALLRRAKNLELKGSPYAPPPGDPLQHQAAALAKAVCSGVFVSGFSPEFATENMGFPTSPRDARTKLGKPVVDRAARAVHVALPDHATRSARYVGSQGCITLPADGKGLRFEPEPITSLPEPAGRAWPMGDMLPDEPLPANLDAGRLKAAADAAFGAPEALTAAFVVTWRGRLVFERYADGVTLHTPLAGWSMGKSVIAALLGILIEQGAYSLEQPAPIPQWQTPGDLRREIRIADLLNMSSGLRIRAPQDPDFDPAGPYPDHLYLYTGDNSVEYAASRPLQWPPGRVGRYHNTDPVLASYLVRLAVEKSGRDYLSFPQRALFDKLGIHTMVIETDATGNFLTQGYDFMSARDWARLGNLYLQNGVYEGQRLLPESYVKFVSTVAPAWQEDNRPIYGGFFWINGNGQFPVPKDAYYMSGAGEQMTLIVPSRHLVVVRLGHDKGEKPARAGLASALAILMEAVPPSPRTATPIGP